RWQDVAEKLASMETALRESGAVVRRGGNFDRWDLEVQGGLLGGVRMLLAVEDHGPRKQLVRVRSWPTFSPVGLLLLLCFLVPRPAPRYLQALLPARLVASPAALLGTAACLLVIVTLLQQLEGFASWLLQLYTGEKLVLDFRSRLFRHVQRLSLLYHDRTATGDSLYRIQSDAAAMQYVVISGLVPFVTSAVALAAMIWVTVRIDRSLALAALVVSP